MNANTYKQITTEFGISKRQIVDMMKAAHHLVLIGLLALTFSGAFAFDPSPLQDFCVALNETKTGGGMSIYTHTHTLSTVYFHFLHDMKIYITSIFSVL